MAAPAAAVGRVQYGRNLTLSAKRTTILSAAQNLEAQLSAHLLSSKQAAEMLGISTRTLRRWSVAFTASLGPEAARKGRRRAYSSQDIGILRRAQEELAQGRTLAEVAPSLPVVEPEAPSTALTLSPEANLALGQALERTARMSHAVSEHDDRLDRLEAWARLPWYRRLFGPPPQK